MSTVCAQNKTRQTPATSFPGCTQTDESHSRPKHSTGGTPALNEDQAGTCGIIRVNSSGDDEEGPAPDAALKAFHEAPIQTPSLQPRRARTGLFEVAMPYSLT